MAYNQGPGGYYPQQQYGNVPYQDQSQYPVQQPSQQYQQQQPQYPHQRHASQGGPPVSLDSSWHQSVDGISYSITNRDTNSMLNVRIPQGVVIKSKPGAMIQMSPSIVLQGKIKFSMKKMFTGSEMAESLYTGPGEVSLAPTLFGDITAIPINGDEGWNLGKDAFLACTGEVIRENKTQGLGKALFSGEDLFVYRLSGRGTIWVYSFGAIVTRDLQANEQHIVDNGHLVAWNCRYTIEKAGNSKMHSIKTGEGLVCRFTGPGRIYIQTRNQDEFAEWVAAQAPSG
ncbi:hypothetical protein G647_05203 [Cladophialophora carrionii CBS 160.54]|uniref:Altered inheritance of mitochondria protein 24, mitochondrial n=1 Tax=Cladophialophora carrionii CBS 160.54 TaxID=1279043 RepID=V9D9Q6_9EURO|nr:uncharacterized protein G647_05203 [Cladophialophora carrionii CBS 160.54]ETI23401.1 hypothetical protein G647_05203 [Cladophialophora carrionii CBS 160.54]